jgi:hypothetical protein
MDPTSEAEAEARRQIVNAYIGLDLSAAKELVDSMIPPARLTGSDSLIRNAVRLGQYQRSPSSEIDFFFFPARHMLIVELQRDRVNRNSCKVLSDS